MVKVCTNLLLLCRQKKVMDEKISYRLDCKLGYHSKAKTKNLNTCFIVMFVVAIENKTTNKLMDL